MAVFLAFVLGPLGLLYVGAWVPAGVMWIVGTFLFFAMHILAASPMNGLWLMFGSRLLAIAWAYNAVEKENETPEIRESKRLLDIAARLESADRAKAKAAYMDIIRLYPNTPASAEAARNLQTLG